MSRRDTRASIDVLNELFRLLRPDGYLITHVEHTTQSQTIDQFKMCGFMSCNPLDTNSSFLIENKDEDVKKMGSLWLCQKPSFDVGYSVPLRNASDNRVGQTANTKKTWTMEDDDLIDTDGLLDDNDRKKPDVKSESFVLSKVLSEAEIRYVIFMIIHWCKIVYLINIDIFNQINLFTVENFRRKIFEECIDDSEDVPKYKNNSIISVSIVSIPEQHERFIAKMLLVIITKRFFFLWVRNDEKRLYNSVTRHLHSIDL